MKGSSYVSLVIPYAGKMFNSSISKSNKALCFLLNKGYLESSDLETLYYLIEGVLESSNPVFIMVGKIEKIHKTGVTFVYRQRIFFKSILGIADFCKQHLVLFRFSEDFRIGINNVLNCIDSLKYLEVYSRGFNLTIDEYLTSSCRIQTYLLMNSKGVRCQLGKLVKKHIKDKTGFLDKAPYLASSYDIDTHASAVYIPTNIEDRRLYSSDIEINTDFCGFTTKVVEKDRKAGVFCK